MEYKELNKQFWGQNRRKVVFDYAIFDNLTWLPGYVKVKENSGKGDDY